MTSRRTKVFKGAPSKLKVIDIEFESAPNSATNSLKRKRMKSQSSSEGYCSSEKSIASLDTWEMQLKPKISNIKKIKEELLENDIENNKNVLNTNSTICPDFVMEMQLEPTISNIIKIKEELLVNDIENNKDMLNTNSTIRPNFVMEMQLEPTISNIIKIKEELLVNDIENNKDALKTNSTIRPNSVMVCENNLDKTNENEVSTSSDLSYQVKVRKFKGKKLIDTCSNVQSNNLILLGPNGTTITSMEFHSISWGKSGSAVTRELLNLVFDKDILASSTLSGKPSPAFQDRPRDHIKNKLDEKIIADVVYAIISKTGVSERLIRHSITTKCADTTKGNKSRKKKCPEV